MRRATTTSRASSPRPTASAALSGFPDDDVQHVQLSQGQQVRLNFTLQVGNVAQAVDSGGSETLWPTSSSVGDVLPDVQVRSLHWPAATCWLVRNAAAGVVGDNFCSARMSQMIRRATAALRWTDDTTTGTARIRPCSPA
jgi:hypothetical protein